MTVRSKKRLQRSDSDAGNALSRLLAEVRVIAAAIAEFSMGDGPGLAMRGPPYFFLVLEGGCWFHEPGSAPVRLQVGDTILALRGDLVRLGSARDGAVFDDIADVWRANGAPVSSFRGCDVPLHFSCGAGGSLCRLMGSALILSRSTSRLTLVTNTPQIVRLAAEQTRLGAWVGAINALLRRDGETVDAESAIAGTALSQFLLVEQLKVCLADDGFRLKASVIGGEGGNVGALIQKLQQHPERSWSIAVMAREAAMSRTSFIQTFGAVTGTTPFRFLAACRMDHAADLLKTSTLSVAEIAARSGYRSQRAFREAFWKAFGTAPLAFRKILERAVEPPNLS